MLITSTKSKATIACCKRKLERLKLRNQIKSEMED